LKEALSQGERRLAAIMFTDMVGYTALGQRNESLSLALVDEQRKLLRPIFSRHKGREIRTMGDGFLVEFPSALDAVRCAYDIQRATREFNFSLPDEKRVHLRVGVHVGDVVESPGDISGDAVNVASRIESLAEDGGVCITRQVYDHVQNKFELPLVSLGNRTLKNVAEPVDVYKMVLPWSEERAAPSTQLDKKRIAVLPFTNISPDPADEYFADGMTEELISTISRISGLRVISRTSVRQYKNGSKGMEDIGRSLGAGSVIEGSVRKSSNRVRITVQLIDVKSDAHLWSDNYDRELEDVFAIQSDIATRVADSLRVRLLEGERKQIERIPTTDAEAHNLYFKGRYFWRQRTDEGLSRAIEFFKLAVERDPDYALGYSGLADCYVASAVYGRTSPKDTFPKQRSAALRAVEIDGTLAEAHTSLAIGLAWGMQFAEAEKEFKRAIELNANYSTAHHFYAQVLAIAGRFVEGISEAEKARELDPLSPTTFFTVGFVRFLAGQTEKTITELMNYREIDPDYLPVNLWLGLAYLEKSKFGESIELIQSTISHLPIGKPALAYAYARAGLKREALESMVGLEKIAKDQYDMLGIAGIYLTLGMAAESSNWFEMACANGRLEPDFLYRFYPWFAALSTNERFRMSQAEVAR
jgi:TolB-like protein